MDNFSRISGLKSSGNGPLDKDTTAGGVNY